VNDEQLLRYSRHILLPELDLEGQQRLLDARVLIVGVGALGSPAAMYLAAAGVGTLVLADPDHVELSNLQRQIAHTQADLGRLKVDSGKAALQALNPDVQVITLPQRLADDLLHREVAAVDVVVDGCDNFPTRFAVNAACVHAARPLVSGAIIRWAGQLAVFRADRPGMPCYRCLYDEAATEEQETCSESGVVAPLPGIIGAMQALETIKLLVGRGAAGDRLQRFDGLNGTWRASRIVRDPACPVCGERN